MGRRTTFTDSQGRHYVAGTEVHEDVWLSVTELEAENGRLRELLARVASHYRRKVYPGRLAYDLGFFSPEELNRIDRALGREKGGSADGR